jgi:MATE family multidrug resistance protein
VTSQPTQSTFTPPSLRALLSLAWPIVLARATQAVVGFCDALMVAPLGEETLAAVTTGALDTFAIAILPMGTVFIVQSFAAQLSGRGELSGVRRFGVYGLMLAALAGVFGLLLIPCLPYLVGLLGYAPGVQTQLTDYMAIRLYGIAVIVGTEALGNFYGGLGNTRLSMIAGIVTMVSNILGNYLLIEPRFGLPGYGAEGAAWASTLAGAIGFGVLAVPFALGLGLPAEARGGKLELRRKELMRVLRFGLPNGMNWFLEFGAFLLFINVMVGHLGTTVLAALNVVMQINSISFMPAFGMASAGAILVANAIGARRLDVVWRIVRMTLLVNCTWMVSIGLLYWVAPSELIGLFRPRDLPAEGLIAAGTLMLMMSTLWQLFDAVAMTFSEALRSAGDTSFTMKARIVLAWFVFMPAAWFLIFVQGGHIKSLMVALIGYLALLAVTFVLRYSSGSWRDIDLLGAEPKLV